MSPSRRRTMIIRRRRFGGETSQSRPPIVSNPVGAVTARGNTFDSTVAAYANPDMRMRAILGGWNELQPTNSTATTNSHWTTLNNSVLDAHNKGYELLLRILCGTEHTPLWVYTHGTYPVPWVPSGNSNLASYPVKVGVAPVIDGDYPVPVPWNANPPLNPTDATIKTWVEDSNLRRHYRAFLTVLAGWLNGPCPGNAAHTRATHIPVIPCAMPTAHGSEYTTSNNNPVNGVKTYFKTAMSKNASSIDNAGTSSDIANGRTNLQVAYAHAWRMTRLDHLELLPANVMCSIAGGHLFGDGSKQAYWHLEEAVAAGDTTRTVWMRTDFRESYFSTFGGGLGAKYSPISFLKQAHALGAKYGLQTAMDSLLFDGSGAHNTDTFAGMVEELLSHLPNLRYFETALSLCKVPSNDPAKTGDFFRDAAVVNTGAKKGTGPYAGSGWPGGYANAAYYLTRATGSVQNRL